MFLGAIPLSLAQGDVAACSGPKAGKRAFLSDLLTQSYGDLCPSSLQSQREDGGGLLLPLKVPCDPHRTESVLGDEVLRATHLPAETWLSRA